MRSVTNRLSAFVSGLVFAALAATDSAGQGHDDDLSPDTVIVLQRGACEQRCAVYRLLLFADGTVIYDGEYFVRRRGLILDKVDVQAVRRLVDDFDAINYFSLKDQYGYTDTSGCTSAATDAPVAMTAIVTGGRSKGIIHHHRCGGTVPDQLTDLEDRIDRAVRSVRWLK